MLSDSSDLQSMVGTDQMLGSELAAITLINENDYHLDSYYCCGRNELCSPAVMLARFSSAIRQGYWFPSGPNQ